jgi:galactokinase
LQPAITWVGSTTDYNDGFVLPTVIPRQTIVELAVGAGEHQAYSTRLDRVVMFGSDQLTDFARYVGGCVRVLERRGTEVPPLRMRIASDGPVGAGLSSGAALEVAMLRGLDNLLGLKLAPETVANLAHQTETRFAGVPCGIMDQMGCAEAAARLGIKSLRLSMMSFQ